VVTSLRSLLYVVLVFCGLLAGTAPADGPRPAKIDTSKLKVGISEGTITINDTKLSLPCDRKELVKALGEPSRETPLANLLLTWDDLGIHAYQRPDKGSTEVHAISFDMVPKNYKFSPKRPFTGALQVEGATIGPSSTLEEINSAMKKHKFNKDELGGLTIKYDTTIIHLSEVGADAKDAKSKWAYLEFDVRVTR
jgi:hypothetical protein